MEHIKCEELEEEISVKDREEVSVEDREEVSIIIEEVPIIIEEVPVDVIASVDELASVEEHIVVEEPVSIEDPREDQNMTTKEVYAPPTFIDDASTYPEYKRRLERWSRITKVDKKLQAEVVVYHLENHPSGIQEKIDTALGDAIIDKDDGLKKLIEYLAECHKTYA